MDQGSPCQLCLDEEIRAAFAAGVERGTWQHAYDMARSTSPSEPGDEPPDEDAYLDSLFSDEGTAATRSRHPER